MPPLGQRRDDDRTSDIEDDEHLCFYWEHDLDLFRKDTCEKEVRAMPEVAKENTKRSSPGRYLELLLIAGFALMCNNVQW
jgi:hypothetical protein